jgi:exopolysaccharide production protein ExoZ
MIEDTISSTTSKKYLYSLQIIRAIAAILVILVHATGVARKMFGENYLNGYFEAGNCGVDLFFCVSGFIVFYVNQKLIGKSKKFFSFIRKRFIRIYPAYWIVTFILLPVYLVKPDFGQGDELKLGVVIHSLLLIPNYRSPILVAGWTLIHEMLFYAVFSSFILLKPRFSLPLMLFWLGSIITSCTTNFFASHFDGRGIFQVVFYPQNLEFILGAFAAFIITSKRIILVRKIYLKLILVLCTISMLISPFLPSNFKVFSNLLDIKTGLHVLYYGLTSSLIILSLVANELFQEEQQFYSHNCKYYDLIPFQYLLNSLKLFLIFLGEASYSIYLAHGPALSFISKLMSSLQFQNIIGGFWATTLLLFLTIIPGVLVYLYLEKPLLISLKKYA